MTVWALLVLVRLAVSQVDPGHAMSDGVCVAVTRHYQTARAAPNRTAIP